MYGYLVYDTLFTLIFYEAVGTVAFLLHHCLGLICCCFGLYFNKMALFGTAIQVGALFGTFQSMLNDAVLSVPCFKR